jgi:hypothetical protein
MSDPRLDSLNARVPAPPVPVGLADRIVDAVTRLPQEARPTQARRAAGRDRRGAWLRRPLIGGAIALGLAFSGAVAATLAGVPLPSKVEAVIAQIPFVGHKSAEPGRTPVRRAAARPVPRPAPVAPPSAATVSTEPMPETMGPRPAAMRRMILARRIVARREALGLPTPSARQLQRIIHRRQMMRRWRMATPEQRQEFLAAHPRAAARIEAREARRDASPFAGGRAGPRWLEERAAFRRATPAQREAFLAAHPRLRAMIEARRARRAQSDGLAPLPEPEPDSGRPPGP